MPRPQNKEQLIEKSNSNFNKMFELINLFEEDEKTNGQIPFEDRDQNIRDILIHLHHWHLMFLNWYKVGMNGQKPDIPAKGYTFRTLPELNRQIWQKYQDTTYYKAEELLKESFLDVQKIIKTHNNNELFEKKRYKWTGTTSLASYLISASSSHYDWAIKKLKKYKKAL